ncbi:hypothetical protein C6A24_00920 [Streptococcus anginosus]|nr:hypothetical protein C6A24_00920 [Streptococcus anginosus]
MSICRLHDIYYHIKISSILQEGFCFFMPNARRKSFEIYNLLKGKVLTYLNHYNLLSRLLILESWLGGL